MKGESRAIVFKRISDRASYSWPSKAFEIKKIQWMIKWYFEINHYVQLMTFFMLLPSATKNAAITAKMTISKVLCLWLSYVELFRSVPSLLKLFFWAVFKVISNDLFNFYGNSLLSTILSFSHILLFTFLENT